MAPRDPCRSVRFKKKVDLKALHDPRCRTNASFTWQWLSVSSTPVSLTQNEFFSICAGLASPSPCAATPPHGCKTSRHSNSCCCDNRGRIPPPQPGFRAPPSPPPLPRLPCGLLHLESRLRASISCNALGNDASSSITLSLDPLRVPEILPPAAPPPLRRIPSVVCMSNPDGQITSFGFRVSCCLVMGRGHRAGSKHWSEPRVDSTLVMRRWHVQVAVLWRHPRKDCKRTRPSVHQHGKMLTRRSDRHINKVLCMHAVHSNGNVIHPVPVLSPVRLLDVNTLKNQGQIDLIRPDSNHPGTSIPHQKSNRTWRGSEFRRMRWNGAPSQSLRRCAWSS